MSLTTSNHRLTVDGTCTCGFASHKVRSVRIHITKANKAMREAEARQWFAGYDKGNLDGYFGTRDERAKSPYADLDPYRDEA